jgi:hypothetical protein
MARLNKKVAQIGAEIEGSFRTYGLDFCVSDPPLRIAEAQSRPADLAAVGQRP